MKKIKGKKIYIIMIIILLILSVFIIRKFNKYYSIDDRVEKMNTFENVDGAKAISWLKVQGTNIDLPVLYYHEVVNISDPTNDIAWSYTKDNKLADKTTIFSHNVLNVSKNPLIGDKNHKRFEQLMAYIYFDFVKENKYIQYTINGENYLYKIYGVSLKKTESVEYETSDFSKKELKKYIEDTKKDSYFDFNIEVDENDKLLTLVTCTRFYGSTDEYSFVVDARKVRNNEFIDNYKVVENKNYKKVKELMKGEGDNA